jgi:DNA helicase IV
MDQKTKDSYLRNANENIAKIREYLNDEKKKVELLIATKTSGAKLEDKWTEEYVKALNRDRLSQLNKLSDSPYFSKCNCTIEGVTKDYYFGKFSFTESSIYSWVAPVASLRFDVPGPVSYPIPNGKIRSGTLHMKDEYQIIDGKILFYSTESKGHPRELVHQEYFSTKKSGFLLPEIVSKMEKAQDMIIRANHKNPFVVSGPAGSGKTTLALHRIAYLMQAPASTEIFKNSSIIVFVQDQRSKDYFSHLLPDLGITTVSVMTFTEWALAIIDDSTTSAVASYSPSLIYEQEKVKAMRTVLSSDAIPKFSKSYFSLIEKIYKPFFSEQSAAIFAQQKKQAVLDRIDLTLLLTLYKKAHKKLAITKRLYVPNDAGELVEKNRRETLEYMLMVVDEFQNYLPEQLVILKSCINEEQKSVIYVGDLGQQVNPGAIRDWSEIDEFIPTDRHVILSKVYRNTRKILNFIKNLDYKVEIPESIKEGNDVVDKKFSSSSEIVEYVKGLIGKRQERESIGILGMNDNILSDIRSQIETNEFVHILTARESQGLEFDTVCIVGFNKDTYFESYKNFPEHFQLEKQKIDKDLLYIALTRAISDLHMVS